MFDICGKEPLIEVAIELEKRALSDDFFISKKLYPNVDCECWVVWNGFVSWNSDLVVLCSLFGVDLQRYARFCAMMLGI